MLSDDQVGRNLIRLRGEMSQKDLAAEMKRRGFKWSQATVWSVEKGERPLRFTEVEALTDVFGRPASHLLALGDFEAEIDQMARRLSEKDLELQRVLAEYDDLRLNLALKCDEAPESAGGHAASEWIPRTVEDAVKAYRADQQAEGARYDELLRTSERKSPPSADRQSETWLERLNAADQQASRPDNG